MTLTPIWNEVPGVTNAHIKYLGHRSPFKVKVKGQDVGYYPAKLLKRFRFSQNVFTFFTAQTTNVRGTHLVSYYVSEYSLQKIN